MALVRACARRTCEHTYIVAYLHPFSICTGEVVRGHRSRPPILPHTPLALASVNLSVSQSVSQSARVRATGSSLSS